MIHRKKKSLLILLLLLSVAFLSTSSINGVSLKKWSANPKDVLEWTLMIYFCADTRDATVTSSLDNSENFCHDYMSEAMSLLPGDLAPGSDAAINVIALYDFPYTFQNPYGHTNIYKFTPSSSVLLEEWGQRNMGDADTLSDFICYCKTNFPANHYALVLSDHGRGYAGYCFDYHAPHPYLPYALGDCLTVPEVESALSARCGEFDSNEVDLIVFNTCLGGSFEAAWQLVGEATYMVAGETSQLWHVLLHPREIAYALSRDTDMTPLQLAQAAFDGAKNPIVLTDDYKWASVSLYALNQFPYADLTALPAISFMQMFSDFTDSLIEEINHNGSKVAFFHELRNAMMVLGLHSSTSMMVDLYEFLETIVAHEADFYYDETTDLAAGLIAKLATGGDILIDEWHKSNYESYVHGFSLCLPDSCDMYHGFLYPNMYEDLKISTQTNWDDFIDRLFLCLVIDWFPELPDVFYIFLHPSDPLTQLRVIFESKYLEEALYVGLTDDPDAQACMGIELGIEGAEYYDDLLWGNAMIRIPTESLQIGGAKAEEAQTFKITVNGSAAATPSQQVNLTVKHTVGDEVVWEESQEKQLEAGQVLSCEVSTNDTMTELEEEEETPPTTTTTPTEPTKTGFIGPTHALLAATSALSTVLIVLVIRKKKKKG